MEEVFYMTKNLIVRGAPQEYEIKENAWDSLLNTFTKGISTTF